MTFETPQKILVVRYRFIATRSDDSVLRNLRKAYPQAKIISAAHVGELLAQCPYIDELLFYKDRFWSA